MSDNLLSKVGHGLYEVADFMFGVDAIKHIATNKGTWGDLATVGVNAMSMFIPPMKLLKLASPELKIIAKAGEHLLNGEAESQVLSHVARNQLQRTIDNAKELELINRMPEKHRVKALEDFHARNNDLEQTFINEDQIAAQRFENVNAVERQVNESTRDASVYDGTNFVDNSKDYAKEKLAKQERPVRSSNKAADKELDWLKGSYKEEDLVKADQIEKLNKVTPRESKPQSAIGAELDTTIFDKDSLMSLLTIDQSDIDKGVNIEGKIIATLRSLVRGETDRTIARNMFAALKDLEKRGMDSNVAAAIRQRVNDLASKEGKLKNYLNAGVMDQYTPAELASLKKNDPEAYGLISKRAKQTSNFLPFRKFDEAGNLSKVDYREPRKYVEAKSKAGRSPELPQRSLRSELYNDEKSLMDMLEKESDPKRRAKLRSHLKDTRSKIFAEESRTAREFLAGATENIPVSDKAVDSLSLAELESERTRLQMLWRKYNKATGKHAEALKSAVEKRGLLVTEKLREAKSRAGETK